MRIGERLDGERAIVAARRQDAVPDTNEIERLTEAAGFEVVDTVTQRRREDNTYNLGRGKAEALADLVAETGVDAVVFDGELTPGQYGDLLGLLPPETHLVDRYRLVLDVFAEGAGDRRAKLQVELATLEYELPRLRESTEEQLMNTYTEKGSPVYDVEDRIDRIKTELADLSADAARRREARRQEGFDLVAVAGYTNAGKSTLLHRLADDLSMADHDAAHDDVETTAEAEDRLFKTLETTTRRATVDGRRVLLTDTVGLIDDLPHGLVESFSTTLGEIRDSDLTLAVLDASLDPDHLRRRATVSMDVMADEGTTVLPVLNKADLVSESELDERRAVVREVAPGAPDPLVISALDDEGLDALRERVVESLPGAEAALTVPNTGEAQALVSWLHDHGDCRVAYEDDAVSIRFAGKPSVVAEARRRADRIAEESPERVPE
jgi:GTP-binding protein HflX